MEINAKLDYEMGTFMFLK